MVKLYSLNGGRFHKKLLHGFVTTFKVLALAFDWVTGNQRPFKVFNDDISKTALKKSFLGFPHVPNCLESQKLNLRKKNVRFLDENEYGYEIKLNIYFYSPTPRNGVYPGNLHSTFFSGKVNTFFCWTLPSPFLLTK